MSVAQRLIDEATTALRTTFGIAADARVDVVASPGRVNLIGEHTDYNDGFVLPLAIDRHTVLAFTPRSDRRVRLWSQAFANDAVVDFMIDDVGDAGANGGRAPGDYVRGVVHALLHAGDTLGVSPEALRGVDMAVTSNLPIGAALSSSASFELAVLRAFVAATPGAHWLPAEAALLGQHVENRWIGLQSGIMDQMVCAAAVADHALLIDCRDLATGNVALPKDVAVVVLDTGKHRELAGSKYNERRAQCETAAAALGVAKLRDATMTMLDAKKADLDEVVYRRARHVIGEDQRTTAAAVALREGRLDEVGALMRASHASLRDDYEVTVAELDLMADVANAHRFVIGARMTGGGFGGCCVALVDARDAGNVAVFCAEGEAAYRARSNCVPALYACVASAGTHLVTDSERAS
ncbi:MAG TPA: galactokinase [Myxococcota bacterium]